jgi:hypothetical protein
MDEDISWLQHMGFKGGVCLEMFFRKYNRIVRFRVTSKDSGGDITAKDYETGETIEFNKNQLLKVEYCTLREVDCD